MSTDSPSILICGACGMLAGDLLPRLAADGAALTLTDIREDSWQGLPVTALDITDEAAVLEAVAMLRPDWIVNCAAFTAVDDAEANEALATRINADGPGYLAKAASVHGARMLHLSTDYVFGGDDAAAQRTVPYREDDDTSPCGAYGRTKFAGEAAVRKALPDQHLIARTSWLHGVHGPNFVATILRVGAEREELRVVDDQIGSPTWAGWLADSLCKLIRKDARGTFHVSSRGGVSWCEFAAAICEMAGYNTRVLPQSTADAGRPAPRPPYSTLDVEKLEDLLGAPCIDWKEGLAKHLQAMKTS